MRNIDTDFPSAHESNFTPGRATDFMYSDSSNRSGDLHILLHVPGQTNYSTPCDRKCHMTKLLTVEIAIYCISIIITVNHRVNITILLHVV